MELAKHEIGEEKFLDDKHRTRVLEKRAKQQSAVVAHAENRSLDELKVVGALIEQRVAQAKAALDYCTGLLCVDHVVSPEATKAITDASEQLTTVLEAVATGRRAALKTHLARLAKEAGIED